MRLALARASAKELDAQLDNIRLQESANATLRSDTHRILQEARNQLHDVLARRRSRLRDSLLRAAKRLEGSGGIQLLKIRTPDARFNRFLTIAASDFTFDVFLPDTDATIKGAVAKIDALSEGRRIVVSTHRPRTTQLESSASTHFLEKLFGQHTGTYDQYAEVYARRVESALQQDTDGHFKDLEASLSDQFDTLDAQLAATREQVLLHRQTQREILNEERDELKTRRDRIEALVETLRTFEHSLEKTEFSAPTFV